MPQRKQPTPKGQRIRSAKSKMNPDATPATPRNKVDAGQQRGAGAKMVGGGLEPGTTDTGPSTAPMSGGRGGAGTDSARTTQAGARGGGASAGGGARGTMGPRGAKGMTAANGEDVLATGRRTRSSSREAIGSAPTSGSGSGQKISQVSPTRQRTGAVGDTGGGSAGRGTSGARARPADLTNDRASAPNLVGAGRGEKSKRDQTPQGTDQQMKKATKDARQAIRRTKGTKKR